MDLQSLQTRPKPKKIAFDENKVIFEPKVDKEQEGTLEERKALEENHILFNSFFTNNSKCVEFCMNTFHTDGSDVYSQCARVDGIYFKRYEKSLLPVVKSVKFCGPQSVSDKALFGELKRHNPTRTSLSPASGLDERLNILIAHLHIAEKFSMPKDFKRKFLLVKNWLEHLMKILPEEKVSEEQLAIPLEKIKELSKVEKFLKLQMHESLQLEEPEVECLSEMMEKYMENYRYYARGIKLMEDEIINAEQQYPNIINYVNTIQKEYSNML